MNHHKNRGKCEKMKTKAVDVLNEFSETEEKLAYQMIRKKKDIQLFACDGIEPCVYLGNTRLEQFNLISGYIGRGNKAYKACHVSHADQHVPFVQTPGSFPFRVWVDCRDKSDVSFHITIGNDSIDLSNSQENGETSELLVVFLECPDFVQFSLFDGRVAYQKVSHIFTASKQIMEKMRTIALSMLEESFPGLNEFLLKIEDDLNEEV